MGTRAKGITKRLEAANLHSLSMPAILDGRLAGTGDVWEYKSLFLALALVYVRLALSVYNVAMSVLVRNKMVVCNVVELLNIIIIQIRSVL